MNPKVREKVIDMEEQMLYISFLSKQQNPDKHKLAKRINNLAGNLLELRKEVIKL